VEIKFLAGEMAKLHNISKQTLIYYDNIDLFQPYDTDQITGYRYYALEQSQELDVILFLKDSGMTLRQIKTYLQHETVSGRIRLLADQRKIVCEKINRLERIEKRLTETLISLEKSVNTVAFDVGIKEISNRFIVSEDVAVPFDDYQVELSIKKLLHNNRTRVDTGIHELLLFVERESNGSILPKKTGLQVQSYSAKSIEKGDYAYIIHQGHYLDMHPTWDKLFDFIKASTYELSGSSYIEKVLVDSLATPKTEEFLVELQVPVRKSL